jgi:hypothetical protein
MKYWGSLSLIYINYVYVYIHIYICMCVSTYLRICIDTSRMSFSHPEKMCTKIIGISISESTTQGKDMCLQSTTCSVIGLPTLSSHLVSIDVLTSLNKFYLLLISRYWTCTVVHRTRTVARTLLQAVWQSSVEEVSMIIRCRRMSSRTT